MPDRRTRGRILRAFAIFEAKPVRPQFTHLGGVYRGRAGLVDARGTCRSTRRRGTFERTGYLRVALHRSRRDRDQLPPATVNDTGARPLTPIARAAAGLKSMTRPRTNGPRSLIRTTTERPL